MTRITLPLPPSANSYWRSVTLRTGISKVLISAEGRKWKKKALQAAQLQRPGRYDGEVSVVLNVYFKDRRRDLDNVCKPTLDLLQAAGILENDRGVVDLHLYRHIDKGNPRIEITVHAVATEV